MGRDVIAREGQIASWLDGDFDRITYLGSGSLAGMTRECQLKILELTAGKVATCFDSSMFLFLQSFRPTLIPTLAVPVVLLGTFGLMAAFGFTINILTMTFSPMSLEGTE